MLNLVVETKDTSSTYSLRADENRKIKHAERLFNQMEADGLSVSFSTQFQDNLMKDVIRDVFEYTTT